MSAPNMEAEAHYEYEHREASSFFNTPQSQELWEAFCERLKRRQMRGSYQCATETLNLLQVSAANCAQSVPSPARLLTNLLATASLRRA